MDLIKEEFGEKIDIDDNFLPSSASGIYGEETKK